MTNTKIDRHCVAEGINNENDPFEVGILRFEATRLVGRLEHIDQGLEDLSRRVRSEEENKEIVTQGLSRLNALLDSLWNEEQQCYIGHELPVRHLQLLREQLATDDRTAVR